MLQRIKRTRFLEAKCTCNIRANVAGSGGVARARQKASLSSARGGRNLVTFRQLAVYDRGDFVERIAS